MIKVKFLLIYIFIAFTINAQVAGPKIVVDEDKYDFGTIVEGAIVTHDFFITNEGTENLVITKVNASCGCTVAKPQDDILEPGESTMMKVTFNSAHKRGNRKNYVTIFSNDKTKSKYRIITTANILARDEQADKIKNAPIISLSKLYHNFGTVKEGSVLQLDILVRNNGKSELKIEKVNASCGCTAALMSENVIKPGGNGNLHIELDTSNMHGKKTRTVRIRSNDPVNPRLVITLFVNVEK